MMRALLAMALVPLALGDYSYSYTDAPTAAPTVETMSPTASMAPTRTETYAPTRMTEAPSYAPTTDTYAPTYGACPPLGVPQPCPADATGLPPCTQVGLTSGDLCTATNITCPNAPYAADPCFVVDGRRLADAPVLEDKVFVVDGTCPNKHITTGASADIWQNEPSTSYPGGIETPEVLCPGMDESDYCDCSWDCTENPTFCACAEAQACCNGGGYRHSVDLDYGEECERDDEDGGGECPFETQSLIKFDLVGGRFEGCGEIVRAELRFCTVSQSDDPVGLITGTKLLVGWDETSVTWDSLGGGCAGNAGNLAAAPSFEFKALNSWDHPDDEAYKTVDVTTDVQAWLDGAENHGWCLATNSTDGWDFLSFNSDECVPRLTVEFAAEPEPEPEPPVALAVHENVGGWCHSDFDECLSLDWSCDDSVEECALQCHQKCKDAYQTNGWRQIVASDLHYDDDDDDDEWRCCCQTECECIADRDDTKWTVVAPATIDPGSLPDCENQPSSEPTVSPTTPFVCPTQQPESCGNETTAGDIVTLRPCYITEDEPNLGPLLSDQIADPLACWDACVTAFPTTVIRLAVFFEEEPGGPGRRLDAAFETDSARGAVLGHWSGPAGSQRRLQPGPGGTECFCGNITQDYASVPFPFVSTVLECDDRRRALVAEGDHAIDQSPWFQKALAADKTGVVQILRDIWGY